MSEKQTIQEAYETLKDIMEDGFICKGKSQIIPELVDKLRPLLSPQLTITRVAHWRCNTCDSMIHREEGRDNFESVQCPDCKTWYCLTWGVPNAVGYESHVDVV